jgi:hypothetical protein
MNHLVKAPEDSSFGVNKGKILTAVHRWTDILVYAVIWNFFSAIYR